MMYILTNHNLFPSVRALRNEIYNLCGERLSITTEYPSKGNVSIRWGNSSARTDGAKDGNLNSAALVRVMANKKLFSDKYRDKFWVPVFNKSKPSVLDYPVLIRTTLNGFGGLGIIPVKTPKEFDRIWDGTGYWTKYVDMTSEFRVHIFDGEILRIFKKVRAQGVDESEFNIRNMSKGWHFSSVENDGILVRLKEESKRFWTETQKLFKIEHGFLALDLGWNREKKLYFILEGNTAPGISQNPTTRGKYARKFISILNI